MFPQSRSGTNIEVSWSAVPCPDSYTLKQEVRYPAHITSSPASPSARGMLFCITVYLCLKKRPHNNRLSMPMLRRDSWQGHFPHDAWEMRSGETTIRRYWRGGRGMGDRGAICVISWRASVHPRCTSSTNHCVMRNGQKLYSIFSNLPLVFRF